MNLEFNNNSFVFGVKNSLLNKAWIKRKTNERLTKYISGIFVKPLKDFKQELHHLGIEPWPDFVVDDHRDIVETFGGIHIEPYYFRSAEDGQMENLYQAILEYSRNGTCCHRGFKPTPL